MIGGIKKFFDEKFKKGLKKAEPLIDYSNVPKEAQRAACAILIELCCIDGEFLHSELKELANQLQKKFGLSREELSELVDLADQELKASEDLGQFASLINQHLNEEQKYGLMVLVWQIIFADGKLEKKELRFAKQIMSRFQVSEEVMQAAKEEAAKLSPSLKD